VGKLSVLQILDRGELAVDQAGICQRPEVLGRLELGRVRREKQQMDMLGHAQPQAGVPSLPSRPDPRPARSASLDSLRPDARRRRARLRRARYSRRSPGGRPSGPRRGAQSQRDSARRSGAALAPRGAARLEPRPGAGAASSRCGVHRSPTTHCALPGRRSRPLSAAASVFLQVSCSSGSARACCGRGTCGLCLRPWRRTK
jgi:hypothetical protein